MPNRAYQNGRALEYRAKKRLEVEGWTVWRTPGSKSPADLIALMGRPEWVSVPGAPAFRERIIEPRVRLIQAKSGTTKMTRAARTKFALYAASLGAEAWLVERGLVFTRLEPEAA